MKYKNVEVFVSSPSIESAATYSVIPCISSSCDSSPPLSLYSRSSPELRWRRTWASRAQLIRPATSAARTPPASTGAMRKSLSAMAKSLSCSLPALVRSDARPRA
ncbi:hypothetical protein EDD18DRAFT_1460177 [Armillaria luteobubalina]|uniref:Uncharacterized protein n=1 Tax=Armillaria luteobubalina TaxID=153913 RepID=A0AA39QDG1_9AGAR|nr:hypothetical protein EDD18DRAFT_1460177 [Armillaria luteobubalina]